MRILGDYKFRYLNKIIIVSLIIVGVLSKFIWVLFYKVLKGYYILDDVNMGIVDRYGDMLMIYVLLVVIVKLGVFNLLKLVVFFFIDMIIFGFNRIVKDYVIGFGYIVESLVDIIVVYEGCGYGYVVYYWLI